MPTFKTPVAIRPTERDPLRNFKFRVLFQSRSTGTTNDPVDRLLKGQNGVEMGFISVTGIGIQTDVIPYREGGDNTMPRKMPGQSNVGPLTLVGGIFAPVGVDTPFPQWEWFKEIFAIQWGQGNGPLDTDFRWTVDVHVLHHPVTKLASGDERGWPLSTSGMWLRFYNCWPSNIVFNDLNAGDNSIMINNMTLEHEGFDVKFGKEAANQAEPSSSVGGR